MKKKSEREGDIVQKHLLHLQLLASDPLVGLTDYASALGVLILRILIFIKLIVYFYHGGHFIKGAKRKSLLYKKNVMSC